MAQNQIDMNCALNARSNLSIRETGELLKEVETPGAIATGSVRAGVLLLFGALRTGKSVLELQFPEKNHAHINFLPVDLQE